METKVVHCKRAPYDVYIGRPGEWGNPFTIGPDGDRKAVIAKYREWIKTEPRLLARVHTLKGKTLACWCAPQPCHGDVLAELAEHARMIAVWPDGSWCDQDEASGMTHKSDDYALLRMDDGMDENDVDIAVSAFNAGVSKAAIEAYATHWVA